MKLCQDCRFYEGDYRCGKPLARSVHPLTGEVAYEFGAIHQQRHPRFGKCGPSGKMWRRRYEACWWRLIVAAGLEGLAAVIMSVAIRMSIWADVLVGKKERVE